MLKFRGPGHSLSPGKVVFLVTLVAVTSCTLATDLSGPAAVIKYGGDQQTAATNTALTAPLAVAVFTQFGERLQNVTVNWTITVGGGTLSANTTQTDDSGIASVNYTTGSTAGTETIQARVQGIPPLTFNIAVTAP